MSQQLASMELRALKINKLYLEIRAPRNRLHTRGERTPHAHDKVSSLRIAKIKHCRKEQFNSVSISSQGHNGMHTAHAYLAPCPFPECEEW